MRDGRVNHFALIAFKKHSLLLPPVQRERHDLINIGRLAGVNSPSIKLKVTDLDRGYIARY